MQATFQLDAADLNKNLIDAIKKAFLGKKINITVTETNSVFEEKILAAAASDIHYVYDGEDFDAFTQDLLTDKKVNISTFRKTMHIL